MARASLSFRCRAAMGLGLVLASCLPKDTRPPPGSLDVTVTADPLALGGERSVSTVDGWTVAYDRLLIALRASFGEGPGCAVYDPNGYTRILDMGIPGPQKLNLLYALGHCNFGFRVQSATPMPYLPLGQGVTPADEALMAAPDVDPYTTGRDGKPQPTGVAMYAKGKATKGNVTKTFAWAFRQRLSYQDCAAPRNAGDAGSDGSIRDSGVGASVRDSAFDASIGDAGDAGYDGSYVTDAGPTGPQGVDLAGGEARTLDIRIHGEALFLDSTNLAKAKLRFDILAAADDEYGNRDGDVTLGELGQVLLSDIGLRGRYAQPPSDVAALAPGALPWATLEDFVYLGLFPKVARFEDGGTCVLRSRGR